MRVVKVEGWKVGRVEGWSWGGREGCVVTREKRRVQTEGTFEVNYARAGTITANVM